MQFTRTNAILLAAATFVPIAYVFFFLSMIVMVVFRSGIGPGEPASSGWVLLFVAVHLTCMIWTWGLIAFYIVFLFKTDIVRQEQKALWAVAIFLGNILAMPIFWYLYIWQPLWASVGESDSDRA